MEHNRCAILSSDEAVANLFSKVLVGAGYDYPQCSKDVRVTKLRTYAPRVLMIDVDHIPSNKLESIRQLRFVLPECAIAVVSSNLQSSWAKQCHMAGANGVFSSGSSTQHMIAGLQSAIRTGCYTDPVFASPLDGN
ncbi:MAG TPA: hypothetical protein VKT72_11230 [Candidatus Baltobacteraceae bacterium]|nr:hypothetical protein [Candidatus Baltobacteraceae bacterium]